jgi:hypothetical protein
MQLPLCSLLSQNASHRSQGSSFSLQDPKGPQALGSELTLQPPSLPVQLP